MKSLLFALPFLLVSCASTPSKPDAPAAAAGAVKYRYENSLDLRNDNTLNHVVVTGYDEKSLGEATRLDVSAGGAVLSLRNKSDVGGAMYNPKVELSKQGTLLVSWGEIDDAYGKAELAADEAGNLTIKKWKEGSY
ncbi:MAG TPA: hypothetical protein VHM91_13560 [Verrucomicrobiales bacterium]|nr:hypothetical protein [Verrucomicrobiales bacterium]